MVSRYHAILEFVLIVALIAGWIYPTRAELLQNQFQATTPPRNIALSFEDSYGNVVSLADFRGRYVLLNLWATWCGPCVREMPALDKLQAHFHMQHLQVIALTEDSGGLSVAKGFYTRHNLTHLPIFVDAIGHAPSLLQVGGLPTTLLIDPTGKEIGRIEGDAEWADPNSIAFLEAHTKPDLR